MHRLLTGDMTALIYVIVMALFCAVYSLFSHTDRRLPTPLGPRTWRFGIVRLPTIYPWKTFAEWREKYGDMIFIRVLGGPVLVLNSLEVANDLLDKRGGIYSSRPDGVMLRKLMRWDWFFAFTPYGSWWKRQSTLFHKHFNVTKISTYHPVIVQETHVMLRKFAETPGSFSDHVRRNVAAVSMNITYGLQVESERDRYVTLIDGAAASLSDPAMFGVHMVDSIPSLELIPTWMPGAGFKRQALEWAKISLAVLNEPFEHVKRQLASGIAAPSIVATELENLYQSGQDHEEEQVIKNIAATVYAGNADTTSSTILSFFLAATVFPEILKKAQEEIDRVVGSERLPTPDDKDSLPYIMWIVWECLRWNPVGPLAAPHTLTEDDNYEGYFIPKGTVVIPNVWLMLHDETKYPDPFRFHPKRYADGKQNDELGINQTPLAAAFGFGRWMCPGRWFALDEVWLTVATVSAVFNISKAVDERGVLVNPEVQYGPQLISRPEPFRCNIAPRSAAAAALIRQTADEL
uniref:Cytochrome P450 monooxygenase n=1 Tax=Taiwanofungus camphoratus TaxID=2696576 RepID=H9LD41_TAICA|nr:cytochrome P450 monooxygenase [Antrodia cinnamomea]